MPCNMLDGRALARSLEPELVRRAEAVRSRRGFAVGLGMVLVGEHAASAVYVRNKVRAAAALGLSSRVWHLPASATTADIEAAIDEANDSPEVDAFLLQLPLPAGLDAQPLIERIRPDKDADGLHPLNLGRAALGLPSPRPCTPRGCMLLLQAASMSLAGREAVVIGRSTIVGQPMAVMLAEADATVTICHAKTVDLWRHVRRAEVLVAAAGQPGLVRGDWLRPGACVIDVGITRLAGEGARPRLVGDVDAASARRVAGALTPVPGGVGPMTIAMLLDNAVQLAEQRS